MAWRARTAVAVAGAAAIGATGLAPAFAADPVDSISEDLTKVTILNINDFHGRIGGSAGLDFACTVLQEQAAAGEGGYTFLSAGDNIGATPFISSAQQDNPTIDFLNALGLEATAVGNHEFDRGFSDLTGRVTERSDYYQLGANVYHRGTTDPALPEYYITEVNGVTVGVIGAVTAETPSLVSPTGVSMIDFGDPVDAVNRVAGEIADDVDIIIAQYHEGATNGEGEGSTLSAEVAAGGIFAKMVNDTSPLVDAIFTGHTHKLYAWDAPTADGTRPVIQSNSYGSHLGVVELGIDTEGMTIEYTRVNEAVTAHAGACAGMSAFDEAAQIQADAQAFADDLGLQPIGEITDDITTAHIDGARDDRQRESTLGNLTAQIWLESMNEPGRPGADIGIMNPGGLRAELLYGEDGVVTYAEVASIHPFANTMQVIDITGAQFKTLLEQQWQPEGSSRPFLKLGLSENVRYTYDPDRPAGDRITGIWFDGEPMDPAATFTIASGSFLIGGGDNFTILQEGTNMRDSGLIDTDAFMNYFLAHEGPVSPSFEKNGVAVTGTELPIAATAGEEISFTVSGVDLTSLGAPVNTEFTVYLGEGDAAVEVGTFPIEAVHIEGVPTRDGQADITFTVPADFPGGETVITLVAEPSGTVVRLLADITAVEKPVEPGKPSKPGPVVETDIPASGFGAAGPFLALTLFLAAAAAFTVSRRQQAREY